MLSLNTTSFTMNKNEKLATPEENCRNGCSKVQWRKNTVEELRRKRLGRNKKKKELMKTLSNREKKARLHDKIEKSMERNITETKKQLKYERRLSLYYWRQWKQEKLKERAPKHEKSEKCSVREIDRNNLEDCEDENAHLGEGTFGKVCKKIYRGLCVALKTYKEASSPGDVTREAAIINLMDHPALPLVFGVSTIKKPYLLVTQFYGVDGSCLLFNTAVTSRLIANLKQCMLILHNTANGLNYIHGKGYLHNDIKGDNVIIAKTGEVLHPIIIDFGKSRKINEAKTYDLSNKQQEEYRKKHKHIAPEVVSGTCSQSPASDIYSFGRLIALACKYYECKILQELAFSCIHCNPVKRPSLDFLITKLSAS